MEGSPRNPKKSPSRNGTLCSKLKLTKRKVPFKHKKCYCLRFADFPQVWTELRQNQELCDGTIISGEGNPCCCRCYGRPSHSERDFFIYLKKNLSKRYRRLL